MLPSRIQAPGEGLLSLLEPGSIPSPETVRHALSKRSGCRSVPQPPMTGTQAGQHQSAPLAELRRQLDQRIDEVAKRLLGEPNRNLSSRSQLRFGRNGSVAVKLAGAKRGQ